MRYRYILCGNVSPKDKLSDFRLIAANKIGQSIRTCDGVRVKITDDIELTKYDCDEYSTTDCEKTLSELGCDVVAKIGGRWKVLDVPIGTNVHAYLSKQGLKQSLCDESMGYVTEEIYDGLRNKYSRVFYMGCSHDDMRFIQTNGFAAYAKKLGTTTRVQSRRAWACGAHEIPIRDAHMERRPL